MVPGQVDQLQTDSADPAQPNLLFKALQTWGPHQILGSSEAFSLFNAIRRVWTSLLRAASTSQ